MSPGGSFDGSRAQPVFYYDLGSPSCYLAAERIMATLPVVPEWEPVLGSTIAEPVSLDRSLIEHVAVQSGLQPVLWPNRWPPDTRVAMLSATYAKRVGRAVAFSLAAFRQAFAGGRDLAEEDTVLIAAAACELHPAAVLKAITLRSIADSLERAGARATAAGVLTLPSIQIGNRVFEGDDGVSEAAESLAAGAP